MKVQIPANIGKVKVAMAVGGKYAVWNGKQGKDEFYILVRTKRQAQELVDLINSKQHGGEIEVTG
jgi:hypothetical protein